MKDPIRLICIGTFLEYEFVAAKLKYEVLKGNIVLEGIFFPDIKGIREVDGFQTLSEESFCSVEFDYILVFSDSLVELTIELCKVLNKDRNRVLSSKILFVPNFDFKYYINIYESNISLIANNCWGGFLYNSLGMEFRSPFINMFFDSVSDYLKMVENIDYYLGQPLRYMEDRWEENMKRWYPTMLLDDIVLNFNHYQNAEDAKEAWSRRIKRFNKNNLFVECMLDNPENAERFVKLPYKKIGFANFEFPHPEIIDKSILPENWVKTHFSVFFGFVNSQATLSDYFWFYNIFKVLLGEMDYMRIKN